jgi:hypothetical protein
MKLATISIEAADDRQLLNYLRTFLNIETSAQASRQTLISKIEQAMPGIKEITALVESDDVPEPAAPPVATEEQRQNAGVNYKDDGVLLDVGSTNDPRVKLIIHEQQGMGNFGKRAVPVAVNGRTMLIPRNQEVSIPYRFFEALNAAKETSYEDVADEDNPRKVERIETTAHSYPFTVLERPSQAAIAAWHKRAEDEQKKVNAERDRRKAAAVRDAIGAAAVA